MQCFEIVGNDIISGLPVVYPSGRPYVLIGRKRLPLSNSLLESLIGSRVLNCSLEYAPGGHFKADAVPTLIPAKPSKFSMILLACHRFGIDVHSHVNGPLGSVVMVRDAIPHFSDHGISSTSESVLARLLPGSEIEAYYSRVQKIAQPAGWKGLFCRQRYAPVRECEPYLRVTYDGALQFCEKEKEL